MHDEGAGLVGAPGRPDLIHIKNNLHLVGPLRRHRGAGEPFPAFLKEEESRPAKLLKSAGLVR
jgi:hypothetical protein